MNALALLLLAALSTGDDAASDISAREELTSTECAATQSELVPTTRGRLAYGGHPPREELLAISKQGGTGIVVFHVKLAADGSPAEVTLYCSTVGAYHTRSAKHFVSTSMFDPMKQAGDVAVRVNLESNESYGSSSQP